MAVKVVKDDSTIKFYPETSADHGLSDYLCQLVNDARAYALAADSGTVAKAGLTGIAIIRKETEAKIEALTKAAETWEERSRDWSLIKDIRDLNAQRAREAREEARKLSTELGQ
jgi:hypothetical protein